MITGAGAGLAGEAEKKYSEGWVKQQEKESMDPRKENGSGKGEYAF